MLHILCFGNPLHGDDGFGHAVFQRLAELPSPDGIRLFDAGTAGLSALALFEDCDEVIIVDSIVCGSTPGRIRNLSAQEVISEETLPGHGIGVGYVLQALHALHTKAPQINIICAEIARPTPFRPELSAAVNQAVDSTVALLRVLFEADRHA